MHPAAVLFPAFLAAASPNWGVEAPGFGWGGRVAPGNPLLPVPALSLVPTGEALQGLDGFAEGGDWLQLAPLEPAARGLSDADDIEAFDPDAGLSSEDLVIEEVVPGSEPPRVPLVGCELGLDGLSPEVWSRELWIGAPWPAMVAGGHTDKAGQWVDYEQIPRRADRPQSYDAYRYPIDVPVVSGYDLDKPDDEQRRGKMNAIGHGGVDLVDKMGAPISMIRLEHQQGDAEVLYVGPLYGETVITRHSLREGGVTHDYVLLFGHLDRAGDDVRRGQRLKEGAIVGYVGNSDSPSLVHLHLEARRLRDGVDAWHLLGGAVLLRENTVVTDPRNVLPLKETHARQARCTPTLAKTPRRYWLGDTMTLAFEANAE